MDPEAMKNLELDKVCRCCLTVKKEMHPLFGELIAEMLSECVQIEVNQQDGWPDKICMQCVQQVNRFHSFKRRLEKLDSQLREYIKGLTVVVEEQIQAPPEMALTKIELPRGLSGQQFIARTANGNQVINRGSLLTGTTPFSQPIQIPANTQLVHHQGQLIPLQMLPNNQAQVVQIQRTSDETCELIMRPQAIPRLQTLPSLSSLTTRASPQQPQQLTDDHSQHEYYEEAIGSKDIEEILDDDDDEEEEEEVEEECEEEQEGVGESNYIVEEIPDSEFELEEDHQDEHSQDQDSVELDVYMEDNGEVHEEECEVVEQPQVIMSTEEPRESHRSPAPSNTNMVVRKCDNHVQMPVSLSDSENDKDDLESKEFMAEFITLQTSCPAPGRHVCNLCHKEFKFSKWLHSHMKSHSNWIKANCKKQPECEICHKKFKGPGMLKMHMKTHEKRLLHCELCLKNFQNEYHLNLHMEKHNSVDSNSFKCEPCNRVFISANDLRIHKRTHANGKTGRSSQPEQTTEPLWNSIKRQKV